VSEVSERVGSEIVMVPVRADRLEEVYRLLGSPPGSLPSAPSSGTAASIDVPGQGFWTAEMVAKLKRTLRLAAVAGLLDAVAAAAPNEVGMQDFVRSSGVESNRLRAQLGALTKHVARTFNAKVWPMSVRYGEGGQAFYAMDPTIARWWLGEPTEQPEL